MQRASPANHGSQSPLGAREVSYASWRGRLIALACAGALSACAGDGPASSTATSSFDTIQRTIFNVNCLFAGCHNATDRSGNMVLAEGQSYSHLVNVVPDNAAARAAGLLRVAPEDPARSFLLFKLEGGPNLITRFGSRMPLTGVPLSSTDIERIRDWIVAGAPPPDSSAARAAAAPFPTPTASTKPTVRPTSTPAPSATPTPSLLVKGADLFSP